MPNIFTPHLKTIVVVCLFALAFVALIAWDDYQADDNQELFIPLFDFCYEQLYPVTEDCTGWSRAFIEVYGDRPAECLDAFDSDSPLLLMCMENIVAGRQ